MSSVFSREEQYLLDLLKVALHEKVFEEIQRVDDIDTKVLVSIGKKHAVLPFLFDVLQENDLFENDWEFVERDTVQTVAQSYRLLILTKYLVSLLKENGIQGIVLKGVSTGSLYPVPEYRKSGDVDLLVPQDTNMQQLIDILKKVGFTKKEEQHALHHIEFMSVEGMIIEVHTALTEDLAYKKINDAMKKRVSDCFLSKQQECIMGVELPVLSRVYHGYELLLHMVQHFFYSGFGLKLLCDWVVLWNQEWSVEEKGALKELAEESGTKRFAEIITEVCAEFLGLDKSRFAWEYIGDDIPSGEFLKEIFEAEDFGKSNKKRMVMLSGTGLWAYIKEFHHQMHLNFPKAGRCFLLWPVLWVITLIKFLYNNKKVRNVSAGEVLKEAKRRSGLMEKLKLFE